VKRPDRLDDDVIDEWLERHGTWRRSDGHLVRELKTKDYPTSVAILSSQVELAE
jgi:pterin-4a-carbinolamine dehydratase